eukprot:gene6547-10001_t
MSAAVAERNAMAVCGPPTSKQLGCSGMKTHELLANLDAAKKQKIQNEKLRNMVLDTEELALKVHQQSFSAKPHAELSKLHARAGDMHLRKFNVSRYMTACAQELQVRELMNPDDVPDLDPVNRLLEHLHDLKKHQSLRVLRSGDGGAGDAKWEWYVPVLEQGIQIVGKVQTLLADSKLKGAQWADLTAPVLGLLKDVMTQDVARSSLRTLEEQIRRLAFEIEEVAEQQQAAVSAGEMAQAEALYYRKIAMQEALADTITKQFDAIDRSADEIFQAPLRRVHEVHAKANQEIHALLRDREVLKKRCELDLASLTTEIERVNLDDYNVAKAASNTLERLNCHIKENALAQDVCWTEIQRLEKELARFGQERVEHIKQLMKTLEQEEKRKIEYQHFSEFSSQHKSLLELTIHNCELGEEVTDSVDEFISDNCNAIERRMRDTERDLEELRLEVHQKYLEHFRDMYLTIGDLQYKKEANVAALEEKIQVAHMQQEMHMESLNPKAKEFSQMKKDLSKNKDDLEKQINTLRQKSTLYIEAFKPTEQALIEAGRPFEHPVETLRKMNESRKVKLIAYHQLVSGEEGEAELSNERRVLQQLRLTPKPDSPT